MDNLGEVNTVAEVKQEKPQRKFFGLSQNVFVFGFVSMLTDFSSEVTVKTLPLFLANALGVQPSIIGFIEGFAETTATILKWSSAGCQIGSRNGSGWHSPDMPSLVLPSRFSTSSTHGRGRHSCDLPTARARGSAHHPR